MSQIIVSRMYFILERCELVRNEFVQGNFQNDEQEHQLTSDSKAAAPAKRILFTVNNRGVLNLIAYIMRTSIYHEIMRSLCIFCFLGSVHLITFVLTKVFGAALSHLHVNFMGSINLV